jgi:hypothetical protein
MGSIEESPAAVGVIFLPRMPKLPIKRIYGVARLGGLSTAKAVNGTCMCEMLTRRCDRPRRSCRAGFSACQKPALRYQSSMISI